jgi:hypothetical protein
MRFVFPFWLTVLFASPAVAAPRAPESNGAIVAVVEREFLGPYTEWRAKHAEFSREEMPPTAMRVRAIGAPQKDTAGAEFVAFAVDSRVADGEWVPAQITGCVYLASSAVYVKRGAAFLAAGDYFAAAARPETAACAAGSE